MKKIAVAALALGSFLGSSAVLADNHTISLGYAQSRVQNFGNIRGGDIQYRYEWDSPFSVIGSFTYMKGNESEFNSYDTKDDPVVKVKEHKKTDIKYYSLLAGPAYRINDYISLYGLVGVAHANAKSAYDESRDGKISSTEKNSFNATSFAYALGIAINPVENLAINVGYEGTNARFGGNNYNINGFNVGIGYRFELTQNGRQREYPRTPAFSHTPRNLYHPPIRDSHTFAVNSDSLVIQKLKALAYHLYSCSYRRGALIKLYNRREVTLLLLSSFQFLKYQ